MSIPYQDEWIVESWRLDPPWHPQDAEVPVMDSTPPLWKDLTLGAVTSALLWVAALALLA